LPYLAAIRVEVFGEAKAPCPLKRLKEWFPDGELVLEFAAAAGAAVAAGDVARAAVTAVAAAAAAAAASTRPER
jgi:hypothetical protein